MNTTRISIGACTFALLAASALAQPDIPKTADKRLVVELVARQPDIVHPVACDFDHKGRLLVVESHTHFAPKDYKGPKHDRILAFDVNTGKATTFFEGTRHTMDIATHPDGSIYLATRNEILRLRETKDGVKSERIVFLDTKGDYPHNGLSGLCFDSKGDLTFGMGENLGVFFKLIGAEGTTITDEQGGHIFHCSADGKKLRRVATGFWNPFGICRDIYGRVFAVDNDPDQSPPCRMLHVVEGGDYGFRFCYGRSGKHPFQSWHGELPGTLPMMTGVGESPCEILSYESDGLPKEYLGKLMVTSWADHRVELYKVVPHGASFKAVREPFVQGPSDFRPTGMCVAPDGSLYVCDWVKSDYTLHGKGAIWHIREKQSRERKRPVDPKEAIFSMHRPLREAAAKKLAWDDKAHSFLSKQLEHADARVRASALTAVTDLRAVERYDPDVWARKLRQIADMDTDVALREMVVRDGALTLGQIFADVKNAPNVRMAAIYGLLHKNDRLQLLELAADPDAFLQHAAIRLLSFGGHDRVVTDLFRDVRDPRKRVASLGIYRRSFDRQAFPAEDKAKLIRHVINDEDEHIRFLAVKWIADDKLKECRNDIEKLMTDPKLSVRMYTACATALARIDGKQVNEQSLADYFAARLIDAKTPAAQKAVLLRQVPANHKLLTIPLLQKLGDSEDSALKREAVRALVDHPSKLRHVPLIDIVNSPPYGSHLRGYAMLGLVDMTAEKLDKYVKPYADNVKSPLRNDALRALNGDKRAVVKDRPPAKDIDAWMKRLEGKADPDAGERIFFHPKVGTCSKCHRIDGRGADVGPDLSNIGRTDRRHILESILQPSNTIAPRYVAWMLEMKDGRTLTGMLTHTYLDEYTFLDANGKTFKIKTGDIAEQRVATTSIMPDGVIDRLTDQEARDLVAYLQLRK